MAIPVVNMRLAYEAVFHITKFVMYNIPCCHLLVYVFCFLALGVAVSYTSLYHAGIMLLFIVLQYCGTIAHIWIVTCSRQPWLTGTYRKLSTCLLLL